jgi:hypothetical protein
METRSRVVLLVGAALVVVGLVLAVNNPSINHADGGTYSCLAPYDHVILGSSNLRGDHPDGPSIADRCDRADRHRFVLACVFAGAGLVVGLGGSALLRRRRSASP